MAGLSYSDVFAQAKAKLERKFTPQLAQTAYNCLQCIKETGGEEWHDGVLWLRKLVRTNAGLPGMYDLLGQCYKLNAKESFDDFLIYLEWRRPPERKFYLPRRRVLKTVVDDLQDLYDGEIEFLGVSLPPRVGKLLADDTPVFTRNGWKNHGDLMAGDEVVAPDGRFVKVLAVHPKDYADYEVCFTNGERILCHGRHEWRVFNRHRQKMELLETQQMEHNYECECSGLGRMYFYVLPERAQWDDEHGERFAPLRDVAISSIRHVHPVPGNCITVEGGMYCAGKSMIPTHNSTLGIMFMCFVMGNRPEIANVMSGHSDKLTDGFFREILSIITDTETYNWQEIFAPVKIVDKSAKNETIDLEKAKRFPTMTCRSVGGTLTGAVEIGNGGILYCDDLVEDLEESLNPVRLQAKYDAYLNQLKDRKKNDARELMVATRWNVFDPLGRIQQQYDGDSRYRFRVIPALDENDHSNFVYDYDLGFTDEYYHDMRESIDDATWWAKYMGRPYIREGLLFPAGELNYYNGVLPDGEPDQVVAVCDTAWGGGDSLSMPFAYVYGEAIYIHDVVFNSGDKTVTRPEVIAKMKTHLPHKSQFEQNNGGDEYADVVDAELRKENVRLNITSKRSPSNQSKLARIIMFAPEIKKMYFIDESHRTGEYRAFMNELTMFVQTGKNPHDDAPDSLAMLAEFILNGSARLTFMKRPF